MPGERPDVRVRRLGPADLPFVVQQHRAHFPNGFFARLGPRFLERYYLTFCTSRDALAIVAEVDGRRAGYLVATTTPAGHRRHVLERHRRALAVRGVLGLLRHPALLGSFVRTRAGLYLRKVVRQTGDVDATADARRNDVAVLHSLVVLPHHQGCGIGSRLVDELSTAAAEAGCRSIALVTEAGGRGAAYYLKTGWDAGDTHRTRDGQVLTTFTRALVASKPTAGTRGKPTA